MAGRIRDSTIATTIDDYNGGVGDDATIGWSAYGQSTSPRLMRSGQHQVSAHIAAASSPAHAGREVSQNAGRVLTRPGSSARLYGRPAVDGEGCSEAIC